ESMVAKFGIPDCLKITLAAAIHFVIRIQSESVYATGWPQFYQTLFLVCGKPGIVDIAEMNRVIRVAVCDLLGDLYSRLSLCAPIARKCDRERNAGSSPQRVDCTTGWGRGEEHGGRTDILEKTLNPARVESFIFLRPYKFLRTHRLRNLFTGFG